MISKCYIKKILNDLDSRFRKESSAKNSLYFSKLAVLELCGWIEESMDDVILRSANRILKDPANLKFVRDEIIKRNYGFDYRQHFRRMLIQLAGVANVERIELLVDPGKKAALISTLATLKTIRDAEAHTHLKVFARRIDAPSVTLSRFPPVYDGLKDYEATLRAYLK